MSRDVPDRSTLPDVLVDKQQWVGWRSEERDGKQTKIPIDPATGQYASSTDSTTWGTFEDAVDVVVSGDGAGVGFVFTEEDPFVGVDLDDCRDPESGEPEQWAAEIIETLNSYTEVSPSGTGYHVLVRGTLPEGRNRHGDVELYETARYFTVTGAYLGRQRTIHERTAELATVHAEYVAQQTMPANEAPTLGDGADLSDSVSSEHRDGAAEPTRLSDEELLDRARNATNGEKFERLWSGTIAGYDSQSEADMALCCLLAFWTGGDCRQMDRLFRESGLLREKWDEIHFADGSTYGEKTIERAIGATSEFYNPEGREQASVDKQGKSSLSDSAQSASTRKLRELVEEHHQLTGRVERLAKTVDQQADRIDTLERQLAILEGEFDSAPMEPHSQSVADEDADDERDSPTERTEASHNSNHTVEAERGDDAASTDSDDSFVSRTRRFLGHQSDDA
ncbi:hypothetical protein [Halomarina rubra]|uniref:NrS-1 polymerase-like HBD domain-containing protein n=1 Tax=Halomarina rubra TaxID=2071873 RepID=A0ABD6AXL5_9EURY|nr:hypothetical protein [Halomarina rubra]